MRKIIVGRGMHKVKADKMVESNRIAIRVTDYIGKSWWTYPSCISIRDTRILIKGLSQMCDEMEKEKNDVK